MPQLVSAACVLFNRLMSRLTGIKNRSEYKAFQRQGRLKHYTANSDCANVSKSKRFCRKNTLSAADSDASVVGVENQRVGMKGKPGEPESA